MTTAATTKNEQLEVEHRDRFIVRLRGGQDRWLEVALVEHD